VNITHPVRPELVEGLDLREIVDFKNLRIAHWELINTKSFETSNQVHELMLLYALQINDLSRGLDVLKKPISNDGHVLQQSQWVLLRAMFEATIKLSYLCCDSKMTQTRFNELERDGLRDQLNSMKAMRASFPDEKKADIAIALVEAKFSQLQNITVLNMEQRLNVICDFYSNTELAEQLKIIWKRLCAASHSRPSELFRIFIGENRGFFEPFTKLKPDSANEVDFMAACFLSMAGKFLVVLPDKNSQA
jgi:hypothetical protein